MIGPLTHRRLRAPRRHGEVLIDPPLDQAPVLLESNLVAARDADYECQGRSLLDLARAARRDLLTAAKRHTAAYRNVAELSAESADRPIFLTGHQPELFHPGVWFKNFVLSSLGRRFQAHAVNLVIDNDLARAPGIRVPTGCASQPQIEIVPLDMAADELPHEERAIVDLSYFETFARRAQEAIAPLVEHPLVGELWPAAVEAARRTGNLGRSIAEARHGLEGRWGLETLELPLGAVCDQPAFRWFSAGLLAELPRFRDVYNASLADYRRAARIRSRTHPVPELAQDGEWLEAPLWIWSADDPQRRRLFARRLGGEIEIADRAKRRFRLPLSADRSADSGVDCLAELGAAGVKLRPRALITTMYARLVLGDLFLHGIGGAKYDELTDLIIERFFARPPPAYITLTATALLPGPLPQAADDDLRRIDGTLRDVRFNPDRHLADGQVSSPEIAALVREKGEWLARELPKGQRQARHKGIAEINRRLAPLLAPQCQRLLAERERLAAELRAARLLGSREFSFCLFPEEILRPLLLELSAASP
jgi:hypothetical protein